MRKLTAEEFIQKLKKFTVINMIIVKWCMSGDVIR